MLSGSRSPVMMTLLLQGTRPFLSFSPSLPPCLFSTLRTIVTEVVISSIVTEWWLRHIYVCMYGPELQRDLSLSLSLIPQRPMLGSLALIPQRPMLGSLALIPQRPMLGSLAFTRSRQNGIPKFAHNCHRNSHLVYGG